jgi:ABC-type glycerol-3-phosphate transport system substrate-binding protein
MKKSLKLVAAGMTAAMMMSVVTSCYKTSGSADKISADDPWYDLTKIEIDPGVDRTEFEYVGNSYITTLDEYYVFMMEGIKLLPSDFDYEHDNYMDYVVEDLDLYDLEGNLVSTISISDYIAQEGLGDFVEVGEVTRVGNELRLDLQSYDINDGTQSLYRTTLNLDTLTFGEAEAVEDYEFVERLLDDDGSEEASFVIGDYTIRKFWMYGGDDTSYVIEVIDADDNVTEFDLREIFPTTPIYDISSVVEIGENKVLLCGYHNADTLYFVLDLNTMDIQDVSDNMSWFTCDIGNVYQVDGFGAVSMDNLGLNLINYDAQTIEPAFQYAYSNVNVSDIAEFEPISVTETEAVFTGTVTPPTDSYGEGTTMIYIFTKADTNPNAGKTILSLAVIDEYNPAICGAVCLFNESNEDYFIRFDDSYRLENEVDENSNSNDDPELAMDQASSDLGTRLTNDLMSGSGPDLIVNGATFGMLNDDDYLVDLSSYVAENFGPESYYTNIFDAAKTDEALYQLPLSFAITGIATSADNVEPGQVGFTFEQYSALVEGPCNGTNPISGGKISLFIQALNCMQDLVIEGDQVNYDSEAFRALAEYVSENVTEELSVDDEDDYYYGSGSGNDTAASMVYISDVVSYYDAVSSQDYVLLGIPSYDGRGPIIYGTDSIAISASSNAQEGCFEFISLLLGQEVQEYFGMRTGIPVNSVAFQSVGNMYIEQRQAELDQLLRFYDEDLLRMYGYSTDPMSTDNLAELEEVIGNLSGWYSNDGAINAIIREEMPAYFEGQKTLDQVIPVIEDRVQTILNERLG